MLPCRLTDKYEEASVHLWDLLEGKDKPVVGTTCKLDCKCMWLVTVKIFLLKDALTT